MKSNRLTNILLSISAVIIIFEIGFKFGENKNNLLQGINGKTNALKNSNFNLYWEAYDKLNQKYVDKSKINTDKLYYGSIKGMIGSVDDPYTFFMTPDENKQSKSDLEGKFEGIGAQLGLKEGRIVVIAPLKKSPSEIAGVKAGDFIDKVDDQSTKNWTLATAVSKIRGNKGTKVKLTLDRDGKQIEVIIVRDQIMVNSVDLTFIKNVAILKLSQFGDTTDSEWDQSVDNIENKWKSGQIKGMVLDLRGNPGGYLESAVYLASEFLPKGKLVVKQESTSVESVNYMVDRDGQLLDIPLTVLIDQGSASASEILSGAIRDYKRGKLVGVKSFGKGSVQEAVDLSGGAGLHVTVAKWILPKGDWINGKGIEPDIKIENKIDTGNTITTETDNQLQKAISVVLGEN